MIVPSRAPHSQAFIFRGALQQYPGYGCPLYLPGRCPHRLDFGLLHSPADRFLISASHCPSPCPPWPISEAPGKGRIDHVFEGLNGLPPPSPYPASVSLRVSSCPVMNIQWEEKQVEQLQICPQPFLSSDSGFALRHRLPGAGFRGCGVASHAQLLVA